MKKVILISGASSGFGALAARALADEGHTVYASMRDLQGRNKTAAAAVLEYASVHKVDIRPLELDVSSQASADAAIAELVKQQSRLDVMVHNAGHMVFGPAEAFSAEQLAQLYDVNVLGCQRINKAILPLMRQQQDGLLLWVGSSSTRGGTPPYLAPYFAAKAAMDALAVSYASELNRWGIESSIIVPGAFTSGTNHFAHAGAPSCQAVYQQYQQGPYAGIEQAVQQGLHNLEPDWADVKLVVDGIVHLVALPKGKKPLRLHVDPCDDGAEVVNAVADRMRVEFLRRMNLADLLQVRQEVNHA